MPGSHAPAAASCCTAEPPGATACSPGVCHQPQADFSARSTPRGPGPVASCSGISRTGCLGPFGASRSVPCGRAGLEQREGSRPVERDSGRRSAARRPGGKRPARRGLPSVWPPCTGNSRPIRPYSSWRSVVLGSLSGLTATRKVKSLRRYSFCSEGAQPRPPLWAPASSAGQRWSCRPGVWHQTWAFPAPLGCCPFCHRGPHTSEHFESFACLALAAVLWG